MRAFLIVVLFAQIDIARPDLVNNVGTGYCAWCSLEMLGRHHGITALYGLVERKRQLRYWRGGRWIEDGSAHVADLSKELLSLQIDHNIQLPGNDDDTILRNANADGCVVSLKGYPHDGDSHAILMTAYSASAVTFVDCNQLLFMGKKHQKEVSNTWFRKHWTGAALSITTEKRSARRSVPCKTGPVETSALIQYQSNQTKR